MRGKGRFLLLFVSLTFCLVVVVLSAYDAGYRINISPSVPTGIWKLTDEISKNGYAMVGASDHFGYRLAVEREYLVNYMPMLKLIVALSGDIVSYDSENRTITVNGAYIQRTEIYSSDTDGRPLSCASFPLQLQDGEAWLSSENIRGYDSRYFGPVSVDILRGAVPIWLF